MTIFRYLLLFAVLSGSILFLIRKLKFSQHLAPLIAFLGNTFTLYICSLFGFLKPGLFITIALNIFLGILAFVKYKKEKEVQKFRISPSLVFYLMVFVFLIFFTRGMQVWEWDEFSYWGAIYRYLTVVNHLPDLSSNFLFLNYPPFTALFQYFVAFFIGPQESSAYFAHILLTYSVLMTIFPEPSWKNWLKYGFYIWIAVISCIAIDFKFQSLYVDLLIGLLFGSSIVQIILNKCLENDKFIVTLFSVAALVVIKPFGIVFSFFILVVYISKSLILDWQANAPNGLKQAIRGILKDSKIIPLLLLPVLVYLSWNAHIAPFKIESTRISFESLAALDQSDSIYQDELRQKTDNLLFEKNREIIIPAFRFLNMFSSVSDSRSKDILNNFITKYHTSRYYRLPLTILELILSILILSFLLSKLSKIGETENPLFLLKISIILGICWCFYNYLLLLTYLFYFYPAEAISVPSLERYCASFIIGWWILLVSYSYNNESRKLPIIQINSYDFIFCVITCFLILKIPLGSLIPLPHTPDQHRYAISKMYKDVVNNLQEGDEKVFLIFNRDTTQGYQFTIMKYFLTPIATNNFGWDIGENTQYSNVYKVNLTSSEWMNLLIEKGYTHVMVCNADDAFWESNRELFDKFSIDIFPQLFFIENGKLIRINNNNY